jgi:hypothetical protein
VRGETTSKGAFDERFTKGTSDWPKISTLEEQEKVRRMEMGQRRTDRVLLFGSHFTSSKMSTSGF